MVYTVLLVDDDRRIRNGLARHVDWETIGFKPVYVADNLVSARNILNTQTIDLLVTDIRLPDGSGLELCRFIREQKRDIPIFILSAYGDFEYAQEAIQYGVKNYFTKPTDLTAFRKAMVDAHEDLDKKLYKQNLRTAQETRYNRAYRFLLSHLWADLANGVIREDEALDHFFEENHIHLPYPWFLILQILCTEETMQSTQSILRIMLEENCCIVHHFSRKKDNVYFLINAPDAESVHNAINEYTKHISGNSHILISETVPSMNDLPKCMIQLSQMDRNAQIVWYSSLHSDVKPDVTVFQDHEKRLLDALGNASEEDAGEALFTIFQDYSECSQDVRCDYFVRIMSDIETYSRRFGVVNTDMYGADFSATRTARQFPTSSQMNSFLLAHVKRVIELMDASRNVYSIRMIHDVCVFVKDHYAEDVSLNEAASAVHLSPSYVSRMFKKITGQNYTDYVNSVKINNAKELLSHSDMRIYEVADKVGFSNTKYFSQVFRSYTGKTPVEYKNSYLNQKGKDNFED